MGWWRWRCRDSVQSAGRHRRTVDEHSESDFTSRFAHHDCGSGSLRPRGGEGSRRPGCPIHAGDRRDAGQPRRGRLAQLAAHARCVGVQPAGPDQHGQRASAPARLGLAAGAGRQPADAARVRRRDVHRESEQHHSGARRGYGRPALAVRPCVGGPAGRDLEQPLPVDRHLRRQDLSQHLGRAHRGARRPHGRGGLGPHRGGPSARLPVHQRPDRGEGKHRGRNERVRALQGGCVLHLGP